MFHPLADNKENYQYHYLLSVQTALWPLSGTKIVPRFVLEGDQGDSDIRKISSNYGPKVTQHNFTSTFSKKSKSCQYTDNMQLRNNQKLKKTVRKISTQ